MRRHLLLFSLFLSIFISTVMGQNIKCDVCGQMIQGQYFQKEDVAMGGMKNICAECSKLEDHCFVCGMPVKNGTMLPDGRFLCARDAAQVITSDDEAKQVCQSTRDDLDRLLVRFATFPDTNVLVSIVNRYYLENLFKTPGEGQACVSVYGATTSNPLPNKKIIHSVAIISHLLKARLMAVCAHEYTHAWMAENVSRERINAIDKDTIEAFCELVAYKYMTSKHEDFQVQIIRKNNYTKGKIDVLIAADDQYGFDAVIDWIKSGDDATLDLDHLFRVRAVSGNYVSSPTSGTAALFSLPVAQENIAAPATLLLKSISGTPQHRFALINSTTFEVMEKAKVRVGQTDLIVRCLEINNDSVTIQVDGSSEKKRLALQSHD